MTDSGEEHSEAHLSRRPAAPPVPPTRRRGSSCASLLPIHRDEPQATDMKLGVGARCIQTLDRGLVYSASATGALALAGAPIATMENHVHHSSVSHYPNPLTL